MPGPKPSTLLALLVLSGQALAAGDGGAPGDAGAAVEAVPPRPEPGPSFRVRGVDADDVLNVRYAANSRSAVVGTIPPDAVDVRPTGHRQKVGPSLWWEVSYAKVRGWVNSKYLARQKEAPAPAPTPAAATDVFTENLTCFLNEPFWRIDVRKDGKATCTETCDGPEGLRAAPPRAAPGKSDAWTIELRDVEGSAFMALALHRTGRCTEDLSDDRYTYEIVARRPRGKAFKGCCNSLGSAGRR
jgi:uncharacterized membrane protein